MVKSSLLALSPAPLPKLYPYYLEYGDPDGRRKKTYETKRVLENHAETLMVIRLEPRFRSPSPGPILTTPPEPQTHFHQLAFPGIREGWEQLLVLLDCELNSREREGTS